MLLKIRNKRWRTQHRMDEQREKNVKEAGEDRVGAERNRCWYYIQMQVRWTQSRK
jgi:hypothetical protein